MNQMVRLESNVVGLVAKIVLLVGNLTVSKMLRSYIIS